jgi:mycothiol synthase
MTVEAPVGLRLRAYAGDADIPTIVRIMNAESAAFGIEEVWPEDGLRSWFAHPTDQFDPARDVVLGELAGEVVATGRIEWVDTRDGLHRECRHWGSVDPAHVGRGIGTALLTELEGRARALAASHPTSREPVLMSFAAAGRPSQAFLEANGYAVVRWFFDMVRPTLDDIVLLPMPGGLELRPVTPDQYEAIWRANREAFRDHWGGSDESLEVLNRILDDPDTDTSLWLIAWEGNEVAGGVWNEIRPAENEALGLRRGWLGSVFTRRPWRRRGLAGALIGRSLDALKERGMTSAILGVDADNATGALGLYEAAGFAVHDRFVAMRKPLELD